TETSRAAGPYCTVKGEAMGEFAGTGPKRRLMRRPEEGKIAGVCAGLADYFDADVALVRAAWVVLAIWPGAVVLGVIAAAPTPRLVRSRTDKRIAGVCGGLAEYFEVDPTIMRVAWVVVSIVVGAVVFGVVAYLVAWFIIPPAPAAAWSPSPSMP